MKRVLVFSVAYAPLVGGAEVAIREITDRLQGWEVELICARLRPGLSDTERIGNVMVHRVGLGRSWDKYLFPFLGAWKGWRIARARPVRVVWSMLASYAGFAALFFLRRFPRLPFVLSIQEGDPLEHYAKRLGMLGFLQRRVFRRADVLLPISRFLEGWATRMGFCGVSDVVPNGVDVERFAKPMAEVDRQAMRASWGVKDDEIAVCTVSRLVTKNAVDDLIRALAVLPERYRAVVAGSGDDRPMLEALAKELGVASRVIWLGEVSQADLPSVLHAADVFVRASRSEGLGISFLEALAAGVPIVGTPVGGIPEFLTDGETGVFAAPNDPASIAAAVRRIQETPSLRARLIKQGQALVRARYQWDGIAKRVQQMLDQATRARTAMPPPPTGKILAVVLAGLVTGWMLCALGARVVAIHPLYTQGLVRHATQKTLEQYRRESGIGLTYVRLDRLRCAADRCRVDLSRLDGERVVLEYEIPAP